MAKIALVKDANIALFWWRLTHVGIIFIPVLFLHFVYVFLKKEEKRPIILSYLMGILFLCLNFTSLFIKKVEQVFNSFYYDGRPPTVLYTIFVLLWIFAAIFTHYQLFKGFRKESGIRRDQIKYFFLATIIGYGGGTTSFLPVFGFNIYPLGNFTVCLYPLIMSYAILKYRLMDIRVAFTRAGIFLAVYTVVLGIPFIVLHRTGSGLLATSLAVVFATMGPLIYRFLQMKAEAVILEQQLRYQRILLQAANGMAIEHDLVKLSKLIVYILKSAIRLNFTAIFILDKESKLYQLESIRGQSTLGEPIRSFNAEHSFIGYLKENREPFILEEAPMQVRSSPDIIFKSRVVIPAFIGDELLGFVLLGEKTNTQSYTEEDINVFKILARQAALAIENCIFFEETKDSQERMFAAEKLASIGGMADGVAHQIKNRLNQFSMASGELKNEIEDFSAKYPELIQKDPELKKTFDYLAKIARSLIENVKRTDGIIKGILDFAKVEKKENFFTAFSLKEATDLSYNLLMIKHEIAQLPITINLGTDDIIYGIKSQIIEAVYNMLDNAYEATKEMQVQLSQQDQESFLPRVVLNLTHTQDRYVIKISDNGIGIKEEDKHKIFAPFFTTKSSYKSGSGIGAYVVKRIIEENHKGKIRFVSAYLKGTDFFIELPKRQVT
ncbi:MAG: ATP-binding protein [Candidatus Omnitrophica bacterium]|nr:ATP-binding protein [Candidatus Omnitrophota bacterium]